MADNKSADRKKKKSADPEHKKKYPGRPENLRTLTPEEASRYGRMGGHASVQARREKKTFREAVEWALSLPVEDVVPDSTGALLALRYPGITTREAIAIVNATQAVRKGDVKHMQFARDTVGESPAQVLQLEQDRPVQITVRTVGKDEE